MDVDRATQGRENGMDACFVDAGGVAGEFGAQHVEPHIVFRCLDEVSETVQEEGAAKAFGKIIAEKNDSTRPGMRIEGVDRFPGEPAIRAEVRNGKGEFEAGRSIRSLGISLFRPVREGVGKAVMLALLDLIEFFVKGSEVTSDPNGP